MNYSFLLYNNVAYMPFKSASQLGVFSILNKTGNLYKEEEYKEGIYKEGVQMVVLFGTGV